MQSGAGVPKRLGEQVAVTFFALCPTPSCQQARGRAPLPLSLSLPRNTSLCSFAGLENHASRVLNEIKA